MKAKDFFARVEALLALPKAERKDAAKQLMDEIATPLVEAAVKTAQKQTVKDAVNAVSEIKGAGKAIKAAFKPEQ